MIIIRTVAVLSALILQYGSAQTDTRDIDYDDDDIDCTLTQWGGPSGPGKNCEFPFKYLGVELSMCTTIGEGQSRPWCPTSLDSNGVHYQGSRDWGYCDPRCAFIDSKLQENSGTTPRPGLRRGRPTRPTRRPVEPIPDIFLTVRPKVTTTTTPLPPTYTENNPDSLFGTWLPDPDSPNGECGLGLISRNFVIGGSQTKRGEFPFMALLGYWEPKRNRIEYRCGGTLINRRYIVTAAHCHIPGKLEISTINLGEWDIAIDPDCEDCRKVQSFAPSEITIHPDWYSSSGTHSDIALVRLDGVATTVHEDFQSEVLPICLSGNKHVVLKNRKVVGWGKATNKQLSDIPDFLKWGISKRTLQKLELPEVSLNVCKTYFGHASNKHICAGGVDGEDSCNGDSGGPLVGVDRINELMFLLGVVSAGTPKCGVGQPGLYTKFSIYEEWIRKNLKP